MNTNRLVCFRHNESGLEFALDGIYCNMNDFRQNFSNPDLEKLNDLHDPPAIEVRYDVCVTYYVYDCEHRIFFKQEEDVLHFLKLVEAFMGATIVVTPKWYEQTLKHKGVVTNAH